MLTIKSLFLSISLILFGFSFSTLLAQNLTVEETVEYIREKMQISDPVYSTFKLGENGETVIKWVNNGYYTEYRFNIREVEFEFKVSPEGDNYIQLTCISGTNNCLQSATRQDVSVVGDKVSFDYYTTLDIKSIAGFDNITSLKNALKYLKIISIERNEDRLNSERDPFLY